MARKKRPSRGKIRDGLGRVILQTVVARPVLGAALPPGHRTGISAIALVMASVNHITVSVPNRRNIVTPTLVGPSGHNGNSIAGPQYLGDGGGPRLATLGGDQNGVAGLHTFALDPSPPRPVLELGGGSVNC